MFGLFERANRLTNISSPTVCSQSHNFHTSTSLQLVFLVLIRVVQGRRELNEDDLRALREKNRKSVQQKIASRLVCPCECAFVNACTSPRH